MKPCENPPRGYPEHWGPICKKILLQAEKATIIMTAIATVLLAKDL